MRRLLFIYSFFTLVVFQGVCQFPQFKYHAIGETDKLAAQTSLVDMDNDGDLDWVVGSVNYVWWFENKGIDNWEKHLIGSNPLTETGGVAMDVDGDGLLDQVSGQTWYKNTGDPTSEFIRFENKAIWAYENIAADINGDGKVDIISNSDLEGLYWYDFSGREEKKWKEHSIGEGTRSGIGPKGYGDIDEDGDIDIVKSNVWYENDGEGKKWIRHASLKISRLDDKYPNCTRSWLVDMDNDNDLDLVQIESYYSDCRVAWMEKQDVRGNTWYLHMIDENSKQELQSLAVADFDNDGDLDVYAGGSTNTSDFHVKSFIYENVDGKGRKWIRHEILTGIESFGGMAGDIDGDGDIDIISKPWHSEENYVLENLLISK
ncbi:MAG: FG-GAP repeat domain-containing protein [Bacteroidales bacterium]